MPHFVIDCSPSILTKQPADDILRAVHLVAVESGLFDVANIKVRIREFEHSIVAGEPDDFLHVFANILEGRTVEQRAELSRAVVARLGELLPDVKWIAMNIYEFEKATYMNKTLL